MLEGLTTVVAAYFFYSLARPESIKNRTYYYFTLACLCLIVVFNALYYFVGHESTYLQGFCAIALGVLHIGAILLTMGYVGGLSIKDIGEQAVDAAKDFQAGPDAKKPVIVPLTGQQPMPRADRIPTESSDEPKPRIVIELPKKDGDEPKIPLA